jgi:hypothetical protein
VNLLESATFSFPFVDLLIGYHVCPCFWAQIACLGAGTGLGEVYLTHNGKNYDVWPAEGGHTDFAPRNQVEFDLLKYESGSSPLHLGFLLSLLRFLVYVGLKIAFLVPSRLEHCLYNCELDSFLMSLVIFFPPFQLHA